MFVIVAIAAAETTCETDDDCSDGTWCLNRSCVSRTDKPVAPTGPSRFDLQKGPSVTVYGVAWTLVLASGVSGGVGLQAGPIHLNLSGAAGFEVGVDGSGSGENMSIRLGSPIRFTASHEQWQAILPELGVRMWVIDGDTLFCPTFSVSYLGAMVPEGSVFASYWHVGGGLGFMNGIMIPEILFGVGFAVWSPPSSGD